MLIRRPKSYVVHAGQALKQPSWVPRCNQDRGEMAYVEHKDPIASPFRLCKNCFPERLLPKHWSRADVYMSESGLDIAADWWEEHGDAEKAAECRQLAQNH